MSDGPKAKPDINKKPEMPAYKWNRQARALQIDYVEADRDGLRLHFIDGRFDPVVVPMNVASRFPPVNGDYFVRYDGGFEAILRRKEFEDNYFKIVGEENK